MKISHYVKHSIRGMLVVAMALLLTTVAPAQVWAQETAGGVRQRVFQSAAQEFGVPAEILLAVSYSQSRWENHRGEPSVGGGFGLMHLTAPTGGEEDDARGDASRPTPRTVVQRENMVEAASGLIGANPEALKSDDAQNIRGGAALLSKYAKEANNGKLPSNPSDWYGAVLRISGVKDAALAQDFADAVYTTIQRGASLTTTDGQKITLSAKNIQPNKTSLGADALSQLRKSNSDQTECPRTITCKFVPARFAQNNPDNVQDYGNYDSTNRPEDMKIKYIVIHDTEGSYQSAIDWFRDPTSYIAAHYVIRSSDGEVTQMIKNKDTGWHAGNWYMNMHSIGVEHEGFAAEGATWYTETMYRTSAKLVRYLADKYDIPLDRQHIVGHEQFHGLTPARAKKMHYDPGPFWDWDYYMSLLHGDDGGRSDHRVSDDQNKDQQKKQQSQIAYHDSKVVTITPQFAKNQPEVMSCDDTGKCVVLPKQGANFVCLRSEPRNDAPLLTDAGLHPDGGPGTTRIEDWSAKAFQGQNFVVADRQGDWTAIWFGGNKGWFYNPVSWNDRTATPTWSMRVAPKNPQATIPVYGRPVPEASAYHNGVPELPLAELQYVIKGGQSYPAYERRATNDYFHNLAFDNSSPGDGTLIVGNERYTPIEYNHRQAFVKASDVNLLWY